MVLSDIPLLAKKMVIAVLVAFIPLIILVGGAWVTQKALKADKSGKESLSNPSKR